jgi:hypothetical protein
MDAWALALRKSLATNIMENEENIEAGSELAELLKDIKPQPRPFDGPFVFDRNGASVGPLPANVLEAIESETFD